MHAAVWMLALAIAGSTGRTKIAVLEVDAPPAQRETARLLNQVVEGEFARRPELLVTSASEVAATLGVARQRTLLGCQEDSCLAEIAGALGVDYLVHGKLGRLGARYRFDLRLVSARNGRIVGSAGDFIEGDDALADAAVRLSRALIRQVPGLSTQGDASSAPAAALTAETPAGSPHRTPAYVAFGAAGALAVGAAVMTWVTKSTFDDVHDHPGDPQRLDKANSLSWKGPLTDGLWGLALVSAGVGTYLYVSAAPESGGGGEVSLGGRF